MIMALPIFATKKEQQGGRRKIEKMKSVKIRDKMTVLPNALEREELHSNKKLNK